MEAATVDTVAPLTLADIRPRIVQVEYAVRGEIVRRAQQIAEDLARSKANGGGSGSGNGSGNGKGPYPFDKVVWCNIGNPQILGQPPITFFRQVLALCEYPEVKWGRGVGMRGGGGD
jgi:alanine transaminase